MTQRFVEAGDVLEFSDEEAAAGWQGLSAQLNQIWQSQEAGQSVSQSIGVVALLEQKFAGRLPSDLLATIAQKAQQAIKSGQPMVDQLIACVQENLSNLAEADLQVMARPMAFAMRGTSADEFVEATIASTRQAEWEALSAIEQARLSLAAARYAISQADSESA